MSQHQQPGASPYTGEYFMLESFAPPGGSSTDILEYPLIDGVDSWMLGSRFNVKLPEPIRLQWDPETTGPYKHLYDVTIPLIHQDLLKALRAAGVDNLDCYRTEIRDTRTGAVSTDYFAANIVGVIAAADLGGSTYTDHSGHGLMDIDFDSLAIDPRRALGARLFRLAECVSGVVVHQTVKEHLESAGGFGLTFLAPSDWIG